MLYIVSTPIGNLGDISKRAVEILEKVEVLLCEDTRVTGNLLGLLKIKNKPKLVRFYDEVEEQKIPEVIGYLNQGREVGLVSDAGTPLLSDPGWKLVAKCQKLGIKYTAIPGPSAVANALVLSGLPSDRFVFLGFLPKKDGERKKILEIYNKLKITKIAFESPLRVKKLVEELAGFEVRVLREMTKMYEEVMDGGNFKEGRGEVVVVWR